MRNFIKRPLFALCAIAQFAGAVDVKISELPVITSVGASDKIPVVASGVTSAITSANFKLTLQPVDADLTAIAALADPNADRILFWDDSANTWAHLTAGAGLAISGTTITADALLTNPLSQFAATTSAQFAGVITNETGSGALVFAVSPALTGSPTAPTQTTGDNSTKIATTAYVDAVGVPVADPGADYVPYFRNSDNSIQNATLSGLTLVSGTLTASGGGGTSASARVYNNAAISILDNIPTDPTFNSERYDTDTIHDTVSNTSRLTCKTAGKYIITAHAIFATNATGVRELDIFVNGTTQIAIQQIPAQAANPTALSITTQYSLAVNDYVTVTVLQNSGGNLNVLSGGNYSPEFMMSRLP